MSVATAQNSLPLPRAAVRLRLSWRATYDRLLRGDLEGWQDAAGRWFVTVDSLDRFLGGPVRDA